MICTQCSKPLSGKQTKYCSKSCKFQSANIKNQNYAKQQERGRKRKLAAIQQFGGCCERCGYKENWACLAFHHKHDKEISLDLRSFSNNSMQVLSAELLKCELLCMNCHTAHHNPDCVL